MRVVLTPQYLRMFLLMSNEIRLHLAVSGQCNHLVLLQIILRILGSQRMMRTPIASTTNWLQRSAALNLPRLILLSKVSSALLFIEDKKSFTKMSSSRDTVRHNAKEVNAATLPISFID